MAALCFKWESGPSLCTAQSGELQPLSSPLKLPKGELISQVPGTGNQSSMKKWVHLTPFFTSGHLNYLKGSEKEKEINPGRLLVCSFAQC